MPQRPEISELAAAGLAIKNNQGNAPKALARNAPVRPLGDHVVDALPTPLRRPLHTLNFRKCLLPQIFVIEANEPLLGRPEDHRVVTAPAMWIAVRKFPLADQHSAPLQQFDDDRVRLEDGLALVFGQAFDEAAVIILGRVCFEAILLPRAEVLGAVSGGRVNDAAALIERDVISQNSGHAHGEKGMLELEAFEFASLP